MARITELSAPSTGLEDVWRNESPYVLGALVRRYGDFDLCEDAVQEAMIAAATTWPTDGLPDYPRGWLIRTASRKLIDIRRSEQARADRESRQLHDDLDRSPPAQETLNVEDDTLQLLLLCCHPSLTKASQVALCLRAVGGLTTEQIASAFMVPASTMGMRISRAKSTLRTAGAKLSAVGPDDLPGRIESVREVLYLIFNEGYASSGGEQLVDLSLTREAIRLTRELRRRLPSDPETAGLLALMLLTEARSDARVDDRGDLIALADQDRALWDRESIDEGVALLEETLPTGPVGRFQLQAAIAAVHDEAPTFAETDWMQIVELYSMLDRVAPGPAVTMNRAVAVGMTDGAKAGLDLLAPLLADASLLENHRLHAVRAHLLEMAGQTEEAHTEYLEAARLTTSMPEQRYLNSRAARC